MSDIPYPMITGQTQESQIEQINSYINDYVNNVSEMINNVDLGNLSKSLAEKIKSGITRHQSLELYTTVAKLNEAKDKVDKKAEEIKQWSRTNLYPRVVMDAEIVKRKYMQDNYMTSWNMASSYYGKQDMTDKTNGFVTNSDADDLATNLQFEGLNYIVNGGLLTSGLSGDIAKLERDIAKLEK